MKTLKRSITVLVCFILFTSCTKSIDWKKEKSNFEERKEITYYKDKPFTGEMFENYENGQLRYKVNFIDGKVEDGLYEVYYENGQLQRKANYKDGKRDGLYERYYENGQLQRKRNYKDGKRID
jgi:antitoxin component YwqK of YwqJK toxin-antitoxin module